MLKSQPFLVKVNNIEIDAPTRLSPLTEILIAINELFTPMSGIGYCLP